MTRTWRVAILAATALVSAAAQAQEHAAAAKPDLAKAQQIASTVCAACHGADGNSAAAANPNLAGQEADYITLQLAHFKAGIRANATMQAMAATLSDADMRALGVYFAQQKPKGLAARDPSLVKAGQRLWRGAVRRLHVCAAEGVQGGRARRRSRRQGRQRTRNEHGRAAADGCADEGYRRLRRRPAVSRFIVSCPARLLRCVLARASL